MGKKVLDAEGVGGGKGAVATKIKEILDEMFVAAGDFRVAEATWIERFEWGNEVPPEGYSEMRENATKFEQLTKQLFAALDVEMPSDYDGYKLRAMEEFLAEEMSSRDDESEDDEGGGGAGG